MCCYHYVSSATGCHRTTEEVHADISDLTCVAEKEEDEVKLAACMAKLTGEFKGGKPPCNPTLLRANYRVSDSPLIGMAVSESLGLIAASSSDGTISIIDYHTLKVVSILATPRVESKAVECYFMQFVPSAPMLIGADTDARITVIYKSYHMYILLSLIAFLCRHGLFVLFSLCGY